MSLRFPPSRLERLFLARRCVALSADVYD